MKGTCQNYHENLLNIPTLHTLNIPSRLNKKFQKNMDKKDNLSNTLRNNFSLLTLDTNNYGGK